MSDRGDIGKKVNRGLAWIGLASSTVGLLDFVALLILLRFFVNRAQYGIAVLAVAVMPLLDLATDMGLSSAVIQRDDHTPEIISTVFWLNLAMSLFLFGNMLWAAPLYARVMDAEVVGAMLIAYSSKLIFQNFYFIPAAMMKRELRFKELSVIRICANVAEFAAKVGFAWAGYPIWCFVAGPLSRSLVTGFGIQIRHPWRPRFVLRLREAGAYARFGVKTSLSQILFQLYTNVDYPIVSYFFGHAATGLYRAAYDLVLEPVRFISYIVVDIAFPAFARLRNRRSQLIEQFIAFTRQNLVVILPFVVLMLLSAGDVFLTFWPRFTGAVTAARILCIVALLRSLSYMVPPLLDGVGWPGLTLIYTSVATVVLPSCYATFAVFLGPRMGYLSVAVAWTVGYPVAFLVLFALALRVVRLSPLYYLRRIVGIPLCAALAFAAGWGVKLLVAPYAPAVRLVAVAAAIAATMGLALAVFQGITPGRILGALREKNPPPA